MTRRARGPWLPSIIHRVVIAGALCALVLVAGCGGDQGAGGDEHTTTSARPPGPPSDACALLDDAEVEAVVGPPAGPGVGTASSDEPPLDPDTPTTSGTPTRFADCSWPGEADARLYLTWVQPSPSPNAVVWLERAVDQSGDVGVGQQVEPLDLGADGLDAGALLQDGDVLRVVGVLDDRDLVSIEAYAPAVAEGSPQQEALEQALVAAVGRLSRTS